jgi:hypothetical protein
MRWYKEEKRDSEDLNIMCILLILKFGSP